MNRHAMLLNPSLSNKEVARLYERSCRHEISMIEKAHQEILRQLRESGPESASELASMMLAVDPMVGEDYYAYLVGAASVLEAR